MYYWYLLGIFSKFNDLFGYEIFVFKIYKIFMVCRVDWIFIGSYFILFEMCLILRYELYYLCSWWIFIVWIRYYLFLNIKCVLFRLVISVGVIFVYKVNGVYRCFICMLFEGFVCVMV